MFVGFSPLKTCNRTVTSRNVIKNKHKKRVSFEPLSTIEGDPFSKVPKLTLIDDNQPRELPTFDLVMIDSEGE